MASSVALSSPNTHFRRFFTKRLVTSHSQSPSLLFRFPFSPQIPCVLRASARISNYSQDSGGLITSPRNWSGVRIGDFVDDRGGGGVTDEEDDEDESDDRSLDLLVRFLQNVFKKISRRARKAVRSVLPVSIPTKLVGFSVNGVIILTFLWVLKAFLEVVCTLGSIVFVSILLIRGVWSSVSYLQESCNRRTIVLDNERSVWSGAQPAG